MRSTESEWALLPTCVALPMARLSPTSRPFANKICKQKLLTSVPPPNLQSFPLTEEEYLLQLQVRTGRA